MLDKLGDFENGGFIRVELGSSVKFSLPSLQAVRAGVQSGGAEACGEDADHPGLL